MIQDEVNCFCCKTLNQSADKPIQSAKLANALTCFLFLHAGPVSRVATCTTSLSMALTQDELKKMVGYKVHYFTSNSFLSHQLVACVSWYWSEDRHSGVKPDMLSVKHYLSSKVILAISTFYLLAKSIWLATMLSPENCAHDTDALHSSDSNEDQLFSLIIFYRNSYPSCYLSVRTSRLSMTMFAPAWLWALAQALLLISQWRESARRQEGYLDRGIEGGREREGMCSWEGEIYTSDCTNVCIYALNF